MPRPQAIDFRIRRIGLREFQLGGLFDFDTLDASAQGDFCLSVAMITAIEPDRRAKIKIRDRCRLDLAHVHARELDFQARGEWPHQLLPEDARLTAEIVAG